MVTKQTSAAVLENIAEGEFYRSCSIGAAVQYTSGTERILEIHGSADHKVVMPYWVGTLKVWNGVATENVVFEYFVIRADSDVAPDLSDNTVLEKMMRDKKILMRGLAIAMNAAIAPTTIKLKFFNIKLEEDEYFQVVILPRSTSTAATVLEWWTEEYRYLVLD